MPFISPQNARYLYFTLFSVSGFTGLIYETIWSHYLKLFLGHAAYAQALVLSIFMGGMALGAWYASQRARRWNNLLVIYALVEGLIGLFGLVFHPVFQSVLSISYDIVLPVLGSPLLANFYKWSVAGLLILPQSFLLGMTFPLMSNGLIRLSPRNEGHSLALLYFTNSIGAAVGALISGFVLIAAAGLPGTMLAAAMLNILIAIIVYALAKRSSALPLPKPSLNRSLQQLMLFAAFVTGLASFIYEIAWLRMLSMVLGASTHSFELMLSAFITGIAFGGLWIRKHIDRLADPVRAAGVIQILMGILALSTLALFNYTFDLMGFFMAALNRTPSGYYLYALASHAIALLVMLPATFCAGMTLPLFTLILLLRGEGERGIGQVYACNTLGAIAGVIFTVLVGLPFLGLKGAMIVGGSLDMALGLVFLARQRSPARHAMIAAAGICVLTVTAALFHFELDPRRMTSSVYRTGTAQLGEETRILFQRDGATSSIHVIQNPDGMTVISTNGKPDASINIRHPDSLAPDEPTMVLLAAIPLAIKPDAKIVANIGMGSGQTTHTLLAWPAIERVDTIEIEPAMVEGANFFRPRVERAFTDPRSHIHIEDARTFFSTHRRKYDIILSEPSNPWVSGVSSLFTHEFYDHVSDYLEHDGLFVQWLHTYEINMTLVMSVLRALNDSFSDYSLFATHDGDMIIIAGNNSPVGLPDGVIFDNAEMREELRHIKMHAIEDIRLRFIGNAQLLGPLLAIYKPAKNSDYFPILDLNAQRARFLNEDASGFTRIRIEPIPLINMLVPGYEYAGVTGAAEGQLFSISELSHQARLIVDFLKNDYDGNAPNPEFGRLKLLAGLAESCTAENYPGLWIDELYSLMRATLPFLSPGEMNGILDAVSPVCEPGLEDNQRRWLDLIGALARRDAVKIADTSLELLKQRNLWELPKQRFLFASLLLALVHMQDYPAAQKLWTQLSGPLYGSEEIPLGLQILHSLAVYNHPEIQNPIN